jgi:hypothetical protein
LTRRRSARYIRPLCRRKAAAVRLWTW